MIGNINSNKFIHSFQNGEIRLRGGAYSSEGRIEIFKGREWMTVCDDGWDINNAHVVCKQLGFGHAIEATHWADHGEGLDKVSFGFSIKLYCF